MKKDVLIGLFAPLFYHLVVNIMLYTFLTDEYSDIYALLFYLLPAVPGVSLIFLLAKDSIREFLESFSICVTVSLVVFLLYAFCRIDFRIFKAVTGYDEYSLGEGLVFVVTFISYLCSCFVGTTIAGIITLIRRKRKKKQHDFELNLQEEEK